MNDLMIQNVLKQAGVDPEANLDAARVYVAERTAFYQEKYERKSFDMMILRPVTSDLWRWALARK
jgi:hypothetical protein